MKYFKYIEKLTSKSDMPVDEKRKRAFIAFCILIIVPVVAIFGIKDLLSGNTFEGTLVLSISIFFLINLFFVRWLRSILQIFRFSVILVLILLSYEVMIGGGDGNAYLWFYFYPVAAYYLFGKKEGTFWLVISIAIVVLFFFTNIGLYSYSESTSIRFVITYIVVAILAFGLEYSRHRYFYELNEEKKNLERALLEVKTLRELLPICSHCKRIRDDQGYWNQIEAYINKHTGVNFSHGICPACEKLYYSNIYLEAGDEHDTESE